MNPHEKDVWHRPEFKERLDELTGRDDFEKANSLRKGTLSSRFRDYADRVPDVVVDRWRSGLYPERVYVTKELEDFLASIKGHDKPRTAAEVAASEVARYEQAVETATSRLEKRQEDLDKAKRNLEHHTKKLKRAKSILAMETGQPVD